MIVRGVVVLGLAGVAACAPQGGSTTTETVTTPTMPGTSTTTTASAPAYTATTAQVTETRGSNTVNVTLPQVAGGVAVFNWYAQGAAHPNNSVATIVIDARTAKPILLTDIWTDPNVGAQRLTTLVTRIDDQIGPLDPVTLDNFVDWVPTPDGFHVYVPVAGWTH